MPIYLYLDERDNSIHEVIQTMKEEHRYFIDGYELKRVFINPQANIGSTSKLDPMDSKSYVNLTREKRGTVGNLQDLSKELSIKREEKLGIDPQKQAHFNRYAKIRNGRRHPLERKEKLEKILKEPIELKIK